MPVLQDARHETFAKLVATERKSALQAYQQAYECSAETAQTNAWRVREYEGINARITELSGQITEKAVLSAIDRREWLAKLVTTPAEQIDGSSPLCNGLKPMKDGRMQVLIPDKLTALKLDALLSGDLAQANTQELKIGIFQAGDGTVAVQIG